MLKNAIQQMELNKNKDTVVNKELYPEYTYLDFKNILKKWVRNGRTAFKINISFGSLRCHVGDKEYLYSSADTLQI